MLIWTLCLASMSGGGASAVDRFAGGGCEKTLIFGDEVIREAFAEVHRGHSSDALLIREDLRLAYLDHLGVDAADDRAAADAVAALIGLRKRGDLNVATTTRLSGQPAAAVRVIAEIAARRVIDQTGLPIDQLLIDPAARRQLSRWARQMAGSIAADATTDDPTAAAGASAAAGAFDQSIRRSVLLLRKQRRLRPELVRRVSDWDLSIQQYDVASLQLDQLPTSPAVYLFLGPAGYLYIGEAADVRQRIADHLQGSHNDALAKSLQLDDVTTQLQIHVFGPDSAGRRTAARRAYESELIRIRSPRFNLRP